MRTNQFIIIGLAIAMGGGAAYLARSWLQAQMNSSAAYQPPDHIVIAAEPLAYGAIVTSDNVSEVPWYTNALPDGAFATKDDLLNGGRRAVLYPLKRGEPVLRSKVTGAGQRASLASQLEEGKRAVTVRVDDVRGVAGFVLPGDFVDIVMIADEISKRQSYSDILLEHVKVLAIDQIASEAEEKPTVARAVTLEVTREQAQKILLATNIGKLSLILDRPIESGREPIRRIGERDIGRIIPEPVVRPVAPPPPAPVAAAPAPPSNVVKVTIVRNGETKEYSVVRNDAVTSQRRLNRASGTAAQD